MFGSHYFELGVPPRITRPIRNYEGGESEFPPISIFNHRGRPYGECKFRFLEDEEVKAATRCVLMNCDEVQPYMNLFVQNLKEKNPQITYYQVEYEINERFASWFKDHVEDPSNNIADSFLQDLAWGHKRKVRTWPMYFVNGYKFHTHSWALRKSTTNSGVCIKGTDYSQSEHDFYGILQEIVEIEYMGMPLKRLVLFKCDWFDPTPDRGTKVYKLYGTVEVNTLRKYNKYDPFIFATQAMQVYYTPYPCCRQKANWHAVLKIKARSIIEMPASDIDVRAFQIDELEVVLPISANDDELRDERQREIRYEEVVMPIDNMIYNYEEAEDEEEEEEEDEEDEEEDGDDEEEDEDEDDEEEDEGDDDDNDEEEDE